MSSVSWGIRARSEERTVAAGPSGAVRWEAIHVHPGRSAPSADLVLASEISGIRAAGRPLVWLRPGLGVEELEEAPAECGEGAGFGLAQALCAWRALTTGGGVPDRVTVVVEA